jgi:hypothetical protein
MRLRRALIAFAVAVRLLLGVEVVEIAEELVEACTTCTEGPKTDAAASAVPPNSILRWLRVAIAQLTVMLTGDS